VSQRLSSLVMGHNIHWKTSIGPGVLLLPLEMQSSDLSTSQFPNTQIHSNSVFFSGDRVPLLASESGSLQTRVIHQPELVPPLCRQKKIHCTVIYLWGGRKRKKLKNRNTVICVDIGSGISHWLPACLWFEREPRLWRVRRAKKIFINSLDAWMDE
jgi:hypothetical protein